MLSPLQPLRFWMDESRIDAVADYKPMPSPAPVPHVALNLELGEGMLDDASPVYTCRLTITLLPGESEQRHPYSVHIRVNGLFAFTHQSEIAEADRRRMVALSGVTMLYGFARDTVLHVTALSQHGPFMLPALNLVDLPNQLQEASPISSVQSTDTPKKSARQRTRQRKADPKSRDRAPRGVPEP